MERGEEKLAKRPQRAWPNRLHAFIERRLDWIMLIVITLIILLLLSIF